mgnify:CR=1 FL=1
MISMDIFGRNEMTTIKAMAFTCAFFVVLATTTFGQELSTEQQEVWEFIEACQERNGTEAWFDCFHEDFAGWLYQDLVPRTKDGERKFSRVLFETTETRASEVRPIAIRVHGNVAVAHYYLQNVVRGQDGQDVEERMRFTDVLMKENGRWQWIADHGGPVALAQP